MPSFDAGKCEPVAEALACGNGVSWSQRRHWIIAGANVTAIQLLVADGGATDLVVAWVGGQRRIRQVTNNVNKITRTTWLHHGIASTSITCHLFFAEAHAHMRTTIM